jgi:hypothetical protein
MMGGIDTKRNEESGATESDSELPPPSDDPQATAAGLEAKPHGRYIVAPNGAPPVPSNMFKNVEPGVVTSNAKILSAYESSDTPNHRQSFFQVPEEERKTIRSIGGPEVEVLLDMLDR